MTLIQLIGIIVIILLIAKNQKKSHLKFESQTKEMQQQKRDEEKKVKFSEEFAKIDEIEEATHKIGELEVPFVFDYKKFVVENENEILSKGKDEILYNFLKIDGFLNSFRNAIIKDQKFVSESFNASRWKMNLETEEKDPYYYPNRMKDFVNVSEGNIPILTENKLPVIYKISKSLESSFILQLKTLEYYQNIASAMVVFYLNDKKINYFEIYESFDKLGVFNNAWQNNVLDKLQNIENRLESMSNQLVQLNDSFQSLVNNSENIVNELQKLNSNVVTNNLLTTINAYQAYRLNSNVKKLAKG